MEKRGKRLSAILLVALACGLGISAELAKAPALAYAPQDTCRSFPETGMMLCGRFLQYWQTHGGLAQQGYPISAQFTEVSDVNGKAYIVQYFERAVFEYHPENPAPNDVLLSLLGVSRYKQQYPGGAPDQTPYTSPGSVVFAPTGKRVGGRFLQYWQTHGGLAQQGYPISDEFTERSDLDGKSYKVQYFERAVFEYHPENPVPSDVLLSQLGTFQLKSKYPDGKYPQGGGSAVPPPSSPPPPPAGGGQQLTFKGTGEMKTQPFYLSGGNYVSDWTATDQTSMGCFHSGFLESADGSNLVNLSLGAKILFPGRSAQGTAQLPGLRAGQYILDMTSGCAWTVTIHAQ